jgi:ribosome biogenesis protein SSF1/2
MFQLVLNNFGSAEKHVKLLVSVFQGLFPPIHVQTMHLSQARRIVLLSYNEETQTIEWRHYLISIRPVGVSRRVRRVIEGSTGHKAALSSSSLKKKIPNLSSTNDISEYLLGSQNGDQGGFETDASSASEADSDVEEGGKSSNHVQLPDSYIGRGNVRDSQRAVRLLELGPRMELRCVKIEEGIPGAGKDAKGASSNGGNDVLWHDYVKKSSVETNKQRKTILEKEKERKKRREEQERNVQRKKEEKELIKTSKRGKPMGEEDDADDSAKEDGEEVEAEEDDEFAYEDLHADGGAPALFEDEDEPLDAEDSFGEESDEGSDEEEEDDSDLSPVEVDLDELESGSEEESNPKKHKPNLKRH